MSEPAEPVDTPGYQRFDCRTAGGDDLVAAADAARLAVERGECIVLPTDTVYGIGADAFSAEAVQRLLDAKLRGRDMPPPVLIGEASLIRALATDVPEAAKDLIAKHWPGPLTVICRIQPSLRMDLGDTDGTIALRVPDHDLAREVLRRTGPMAVSSANLSGKPAALTCDEAVEQLGASVSVYLDGGELVGSDGAPSTIVDFTRREQGEVLRLGALSLAVLRETLPDVTDLTEAAAAPGVPESTEVPESTGKPEPTGEPELPEPVLEPAELGSEADDPGESVEFEEGKAWAGYADEDDDDEPQPGVNPTPGPGPEQRTPGE